MIFDKIQAGGNETVIATNVIILRKIPYGESSLIAATLSSEYGRIDFLIKGAKKIGKRKFPQADLFRELYVQYKDSQRDLHSLYSTDVLNNYDAMASFPENYVQACELGKFLLRNSRPNIPCPKVYAALKNALEHFSRAPVKIPWRELVKLVYLQENGLLPGGLSPSEGDNKKEARRKMILEELLESAFGKKSPPELSTEYWARLVAWINGLCNYNELI